MESLWHKIQIKVKSLLETRSIRNNPIYLCKMEKKRQCKMEKKVSGEENGVNGVHWIKEGEKVDGH